MAFPFPVLYSTPRAEAVADFVLDALRLARSDRLQAAISRLERYLRDQGRRRQSASSCVFQSGVRAASPTLPRKPAFSPIWTGRMFRSRPHVRRVTARCLRLLHCRKVNVTAVLFRHAEGRPSRARNSLADARANGVTLARMHDAADGFAAGDQGRYRLDCDHLLRRPLSFILSVEDLERLPCAKTWYDLTKRLSDVLAERNGLSGTYCHGDCHGYNAHIGLAWTIRRTGRVLRFR